MIRRCEEGAVKWAFRDLRRDDDTLLLRFMVGVCSLVLAFFLVICGFDVVVAGGRAAWSSSTYDIQVSLQ